MPDTAYQEYAELFKVMPWSKTIEDFNIAIIAGCPAKVEDPERFFETKAFKAHVIKYLVSKKYQYNSNNCTEIHPKQEETYSLFNLDSWVGIPDER